MISKRRFLAKIICILIIINCFFQSKQCLAEEEKILILYDYYKEFEEDKNILNEVVNVAITLNRTLDIVRFKDYKEGNLKKYNGVIVILNSEERLSEHIEKDLKIYNSTIFIINKETKNSFKKNLPKFFNKENKKYKNYLVLDEVYPFEDLNGLVEKIDYLYKNGINFIVSVMPVFRNYNSQSMQRFAEVLRYAQAKGGTIVLHNPYIYLKDNTEADIKNVLENMDIAQNNYINYWVYPRALDIQNSWIYKDGIQEYISKSNTILLSKEDKTNNNFITKYSIKKIENVIEKVNLDEIKNKEENYCNKAYKIKADISFEDFEKEINKLKDNNIYISDLANVYTNINLGINKLEGSNNIVLLNNKNINIKKYISKEEFNKYFNKENTDIKDEKLGVDLSKVNNIIIIVTFVIVIVLIIIALNSRIKNKRKFYK
ncbi:hypothetical protein JCM1393_22200 [Clostridium carnis]